MRRKPSMSPAKHTRAEAAKSSEGARKQWDVPRVMELTTQRDVKSGGPGNERDNPGSGTTS